MCFGYPFLQLQRRFQVAVLVFVSGPAFPKWPTTFGENVPITRSKSARASATRFEPMISSTAQEPLNYFVVHGYQEPQIPQYVLGFLSEQLQTLFDLRRPLWYSTSAEMKGIAL